MNKQEDTVKIKVKGYKKFVKRTKKMRKAVNQLNKSLGKTIELQKQSMKLPNGGLLENYIPVNGITTETEEKRIGNKKER